MSHHSERAKLAWLFADMIQAETGVLPRSTLTATIDFVDKWFLEPGSSTRVIASARALLAKYRGYNG